jgi:hypothetical protein
MKVHLIRSKGFEIEDFNNVLNLLKATKGPIEFVPSEPIVLPESDNFIHYEDLKSFEKKHMPEWSMVHSYMPDERVFPMTKPVFTWEQLFQICQDFRSANNIPDTDHVMLLTEHANDLNWFGAIDESMKNYFIHTADWDHYFQNNVDVRFPIAYEIIVWLLRSLMFENQIEILHNAHDIAQGCMMDYCQNKKDITIKMRTADVCPSCTELITNRDIRKNYLKQLFDTMESIRKNLLFRQRSVLLNEPSRMEIRGYRKDIFLSDLGDLQINLNPKEKTLYLLYLNHPEGINLSCLIDHKEELTSYYSMLTVSGSTERVETVINKMIDYRQAVDVSIQFSKIKNKFTTALGEFGNQYAIEKVCDKHKIVLNRELVQFVD